jgi:hypothetical protein
MCPQLEEDRNIGDNDLVVFLVDGSPVAHLIETAVVSVVFVCGHQPWRYTQFACAGERKERERERERERGY